MLDSVDVKRKMKWEKEILKYMIKQGMSEKKALSRDLNEVREESYAMVVTWHWGGVVLIKQNDILEYLLYTRPCSGGPGDSNEQDC